VFLINILKTWRGPRNAPADPWNGATLECLEVLETLKTGLSALQATGQLARRDLPLLDHMLEVALEDRPVQIPYQRFFKAPLRP